jgi:hypothetical protein
VVVEPVAPRPSWWHCLVVAIVLVFVAPPHQSCHDRRVVVVVVEPRYRLPLAPRGGTASSLPVSLPASLSPSHHAVFSSSGVVVVIERSRRSLLVTIVAVVRRLLLEPKPLRPLARSPVTSLIS